MNSHKNFTPRRDMEKIQVGNQNAIKRSLKIDSLLESTIRIRDDQSERKYANSTRNAQIVETSTISQFRALQGKFIGGLGYKENIDNIKNQILSTPNSQKNSFFNNYNKAPNTNKSFNNMSSTSSYAKNIKYSSNPNSSFNSNYSNNLFSHRTQFISKTNQNNKIKQEL